ncbi:hypothetical protein ISF_09179 [Cordyceps fumosorosea ARSEF 2679]|uniref:Tat pathway signal sequence n=1 Tax=Cordyceps fumosorosea (strain ARSEF 2679) TaxID=1081104 RepID=A0A167LBT3_CORFA|nr:hypothetical protein ISF_09179 [Cordyceps fumosorosea ARSEF 2679]OAA52901.1 hypothetical protein ISF_09179 [Cordyceps fumosorosea ARSEF 2679]
MAFFTQDDFNYHPVGEDSGTEKATRNHPGISRLPWLLCCFISVLAFAVGALVGVFVLAPQPSRLATSMQQRPSRIPTPDIDIDVIPQTFHYNRTFGEAPDHKGTLEAWESVVPVGQGTVRFPSESHNLYTLSVVHQLHCLWSIHGSYYSKANDESDAGHGAAHMRHCFDYLRQGLMCASDTSLEPVDPDLGGVTGWGSERVCRDYRQVVAWAEDHRVSNLRGFQQTPHHHHG